MGRGRPRPRVLSAAALYGHEPSPLPFAPFLENTLRFSGASRSCGDGTPRHQMSSLQLKHVTPTSVVGVCLAVDRSAELCSNNSTCPIRRRPRESLVLVVVLVRVWE